MRRFTDRGGWWVAAQGALMFGILVAWLAGGSAWGPLARIGGLVLAFVGAVLGIAGMGFLGRNLTPYPSPRDGTVLVDRGPYRLVRHPIYGGLVLGAAGLSVADGNLVALALSLVLAALFTVKSAVEERHLVAAVPGYDAYRRRVRGRILPFVP